MHLGAVADIGQVKVLFVDHHQVLDRDHSDTCRQTGRVGVENIEAIEKFRQFALDHERIPFVFVLSFIGSSGRYQACKDIWSNSEGIHHLFDGIICTFEPEGPTCREGCSYLEICRTVGRSLVLLFDRRQC